MKNGIKIMNFESADVLRSNVERESVIKEKWEAVFSNSMLSDKLKKDLTVKDFKTKDIINLKFNMPIKIDNIESYKDYNTYINKKENKIGADNIRKILYKEGFELAFDKPSTLKGSKKLSTKVITDYKNKQYIKIDKDGNEIEKEAIEKEIIKYKFWFRSSAKARVGECLYISEELLNDIVKWQCMGIELPEDKECMVVEMMAYMALTASTIEGYINLNPDEILVINDLKSRHLTKCAKVTTDENKECKVDINEDYVENVLFDGQAIADDSIFEGKAGMKLLRHHFFKACAFRGYIEKFYRDYFGDDYETATVKDRYGNDVLVKKIKLITTENAMKWEKFFENKSEGFEEWKKAVNNDGNKFGVCKEDHESKFGDKQRMSYQMLNTLPVSKDELLDIATYSIEYINSLKKVDNIAFKKHLAENKSIMLANEMMLDLSERNKGFSRTEIFKDFKATTINKLKDNLRKGKLMVDADNLTVVGNPYLMLLHSVGEVEVDNEGYIITKDETLPISNDYISVYTKRFKKDEDLVAFRNPHNSPNNIALFKNFKNDLMDKYFNFSKNIVAVNLVDTELQDLANGMDADSDFMFTTNDKNIVKVVKEKVFRNENYPCIVNKIVQSKKKYTNTLENKAIIDNALAKGKNDIGTSSNQAQLSMSIFANSEYKDKELLNKVMILSVLAQVAIDNAKRVYKVDACAEIRRLTTEGNRPLFFYYIKNNNVEYKAFNEAGKCIGVFKNKYEAKLKSGDYGYIKKTHRKKSKEEFDSDIHCTMNILQEVIDENVKNASKKKGDTVEFEKLILKFKGKPKYEQVDKIVNMVEEWNNFVISNNYSEEEDKDKKKESKDQEEYLVEEIIKKIKKMSITDKTMSYLIESVLNKDSINSNSHIRLKLLNALYQAKKEQFLNQFEFK